MRHLSGKVVFAAIVASYLLLYQSPVIQAQPASTDVTEELWHGVESFGYQLQDVDVDYIADTAFDLVIIDYSQDGTEEERFSKDQIERMKYGGDGGKLVLSYLSIGEAENYRWYWNAEWDLDNDGQPDEGAPAWLGPANPEWPGNYKVRYWEAGWQAIIFEYLDTVVDAGFDGVYLDIIDAYEYWGPGGESTDDRVTSEQEMVEFVKQIADHTRSTSGNPNFGVFPQNGDALASHPEYVAVTTGIGKEDTWFFGDTPTSTAYTEEAIKNLDIFRGNEKLVLVIDYVTSESDVAEFYINAVSKGYVPYASTRELDALPPTYPGSIIVRHFEKTTLEDNTVLEAEIMSSSDISDFYLNEEEKYISFNVLERWESGYTTILVSQILLGPYTLIVDGQPQEFEEIDNYSTNSTLIKIGYTGGSHEVVIIGSEVIPELPESLYVITCIFVAMVVGRKIYSNRREIYHWRY